MVITFKISTDARHINVDVYADNKFWRRIPFHAEEIMEADAQDVKPFIAYLLKRSYVTGNNAQTKANMEAVQVTI